MCEAIYKRIWELSPHIKNQEAYIELTHLTKGLIDLYEQQGRLDSDPFDPTRLREIRLPVDGIKKELKNSTCVVSGGMGCVGTLLVKALLKFGVAKVIILDNSRVHFTNYEKVTRYNCDIRNFSMLQEIFSIHRPEFVFHTAAQRDPGLAERHIAETVTTNVLGTLNIIKVCEDIGSVKQLVSSSTGKASRYFTKEVYAGTKKMTEFMLDTYAHTSRIKYSMVRCTHILDNSLMDVELRKAVETNDYVNVHSPAKYVTAQNAQEAVSLMLNALLHSKVKECRFLLVRHLAWPVESLQVALYCIKQSRRDIPVVFAGNPLGYSEKFFRGQLDWTRPGELNLLINVYECRHQTQNPTGDIIIARPCSTNRATLDEVLEDIENVRGEVETRAVLINGLKQVVQEALKKVEKHDTLNILQWGLNNRVLERENDTLTDFYPLVSLLTESLEGSKYHKEVEELIYQNA